MIPLHWTSALGNHLWQSTIFAAAAALLTFALRKNQAQVRYWLWLIASLKFLIPFSSLVAIGRHLGWLTAAPITQPAFSTVVEQVSQPFAAPAVHSAALAPAASLAASPLPIFLLIIWACGLLAVAFSWWRRWVRIRTAVRAAKPLQLGIQIEVLSSPALLEPGVFGIFRPVLLLPEGITDHLASEQLEAIVLHELCHVRRRDNLWAALHMSVAAIFWFHPLVWWIGARLVEERERACDEEVLRLGNEPQVYAESILKTCQFYLESPLVCVSGVTGSDLKKRIVRIMTQRIAKRLNFGRKILLAAAGMAAVAVPVIVGLVNAPQGRAQSEARNNAPLPFFEVASIKPAKSGGGPGMFRIGIEDRGGRFVANGVNVKTLLEIAYHVKESQIENGPSWINSERYDIEAKAGDAETAAMQKLGPDERGLQVDLMLQSLLADRFKVTIGHETKELPVYVLTVAKNGPKFHESTAPADPGPPNPEGPPGPPESGGRLRERPRFRRGIMMNGRGQLNVMDASMDMFINVLSRQLGRVVLDQTGLKARYDFALQWTPEQNEGPMMGPGGPGADSAPPPDTSGPTIFTALQEQLGLKLESKKAPVDTLVIEHVERPSEN